MRKRTRAFTLVEVLLALALTGLVASLALAPVIYAVRRVVDTQAAWSDETALLRTATFMAQDIAAGLRLASVVVRTVRRGMGEGDTLIVASSAPAKQNLAAGSIVYKIVRERFMSGAHIPGLYRWLLSGVLPEAVKPESLEEKNAQLVAPYITDFEVSVLKPPEWVSDYSGRMPDGIRLTLSRGEERVEYVFTFPR